MGDLLRFLKDDLLAAAFGDPNMNTQSKEAARQTITLTKNDGILPLTDAAKKIAVIGPMGATVRAFYGCYTLAGGLEMAMSGQNAMAGVEGKDPMNAVHNAVVLEELAFMAFHTEALQPEISPMQQELLDKHYLRKHGKDAYYGQN